jgi:hypothetical protein
VVGATQHVRIRVDVNPTEYLDFRNIRATERAVDSDRQPIS